ncbi:PAS domain-containing protein [Sutterella massiliensis]|uniref:PAS domain-containing protein n=1 Tax=Sutterella massiliensis TaxID=1816689 RepID=A0ABS2DUI9_9BURK|nr:PAS domain-containing protein [Sutterella massiliensis]MBM6704962.1 PAS domain-containing protein [Sutterella massiliensis]
MHPLLESYVPVADLIVRTFGEDCEVLLHDLTSPHHSVVYAANNRVTGRHVGDTFRNLVPKALFSAEEGESIVANYYYEREGRLVRSSVLFIHDADGGIVGALCINVDSTQAREQLAWLQKSLPDFEAHRLKKGERPFFEPKAPVEGDRKVHEMVYDLIDKILAESAENLATKEGRVELIRFMNERGIFLMKGALERVAERLGISKVTVYSYLDEVRRKA